MTTTPTQNSVPSESPIDLKFNAGKIDEFVTSMVNAYVDRFGKEHYTIEGLKNIALQQIYDLGWNPVGTFQDGTTVNGPGDIVQDESTGVWYRWDDISSLPKTIPSGSTPSSSGGTGEGKWLAVDVSDVLRKQLAADGSQISIAGETAEDVARAKKTAKLLSQYSHVASYADDNAKILSVFDKENCSIEGGIYNLNDSFDFSENKRIRVNKDTTINVTGQIDQLFRFLGHVAWDGLGKLTINANHNDKSDRTESILCSPNFIPTLNNIDVHAANGLPVLVGMARFGPEAPVAQGSGYIKDIRTFDCGKGVHVYGNVNKDTTIITENLYTDNMTGYLNGAGQGGGGNTFYLSYHRYAKNIGGYFEHHPDSYGPNINRSLYGAYEGGWFQGADGTQSRGPTFGEDLDYGAIYGGGVSRNCGFAAISADIRKSDGSYPISRLVIDGWTAIGCGRTLYSQAQDLSFGNIHTKESKSSDFLIRINGANPKSVKQIGVITAFNGISSTKPSLVWADKTSSLYLIPAMIISDDIVNVNVPVVADNSTSTGSTINIGTQYPIVTSDYLVPNIREAVEVDLSSISSVLTLRLPAANLSNLKGMQHKLFVRGGNGVKTLRITVSNADGTINDSAGPIDFSPSAGSVRVIECLNKGSGNYLVTT